MTTIDPSVEILDQITELERRAALATHLELDRETRRLIAEGAWPRLTAERRLRSLVGLHVALYGEAAAVTYAQSLIHAVHAGRQRLERRGATPDWMAPLFASGASDGAERGATDRVVQQALGFEAGGEPTLVPPR